jgi:hypothetical protein
MQQAQAMTAPILKMWSDGLSMAAQGLEASQAQGKKMAESAFEVATAVGKDYLQYADDVRTRAAQAAGSANELLKEQAALVNDMAKDPAGATQRVIAGWAEGSRKSMEMGADALKGYVGLLDSVWSRMEKASHDARQNYIEYVKALQGIVESKSKE